MGTLKSLWRAVLIGSLLGSIALFVLQCTLQPESGTFGLTFFNAMADAPSATGRVLDVASGSPARRAGIRIGDEIPFGDTDGAVLLHPLPNERLSLAYARDGVERRTSMTAQAKAPYAWTIPDAIRLAIALCLMAFSLAVIARAWNTKHGPIIATILASIVLNAAADRLPIVARSGTAAQLLVANYTLARLAFTFGEAMLAVLLYQIVEPPSRVLRALSYASLVLCAVSTICAGLVFASSLAGRADPFVTMVFGYWISLQATIAVALAALVVALYDARGESRQRVRWLFWAFAPFFLTVSLTTGVYFIPASAAYMAVHPQQALVYQTLDRLLALSLPAGLFFGVLLRRVLDLGFVLNRVAVYSALSIVLLAIFVLFEYGISKLFLDTSRTGSLLIQLGIALAIGLSARYLHGIVDRIVDRMLFAKRHADESALRRFSQETEAYTSAAALLDRAIEVLTEHSEARGAGIYMATDGRVELVRSSNADFPATAGLDDPLLVKLRRWNEPVDTAEVKTVIPDGMAFPMNARGKFIGTLVCEKKRDESTFDPDERASLLEVARSVGIALGGISGNAGTSVETLHGAMISMQAAILALPQKIASELRSEREPERS